ncbi:RNA polymerase sigma factor RpoE [soil metagenome]
MAERSDYELVNQCLEGDNRAFDLLVQRYEVQMFRTAFGIVNDAELAKDITQAGFLRSWENLQTFNPKYKFYSWLYRIIINEALNMSRRQKKFQVLTLYKSDDETPYEVMTRKEENGSLMKAIESLPVDCKIVLQLRHFEELSYKEIADILNIETKTVKSRLYSARMQLRSKLYNR